jgi:APA family basic amino acid/polyamine antiporter
MLEKVTLVAEGAKQKYYLLPEGFVSNAAKQITLDNGTSAQGFTVDQMRQLLVTYAEGDRILGIMNLPGFLIVLLITCLLVIGVHESAKVNNIIVIVKSAVIIGFAIIGAFYVDSSNWQPFIPENTGSWGVFGYSGILAAAGVIFFAYIGFEAVSTAAQEAKNPQKDIPIGIMGSLLMCTFLYIAVALVLTGLVPYTELAVPDPIALGVNAIGMDWLSFMVKVGAIAGLTSVMLVTMYGQTRIFYNVSKDGLLPPVFATIHEKFKTPYINTVLVGLLVATAAALTPISALGSLVSVGTLVAFAMVCFTVIYLRVKHPELERPFRCPGAPIVPALGILSCLALVAGQWQTLLTLKVYMGLGFLFYFLYGYRKSRLAKAQNASA